MAFSFGTTNDAPEVLKLLEGESYKGNLRIIFTRRDDPIAAFKSESDGAITGIMRDTGGRLIATITAIPRIMYIGGELKRVAYITGLKKDLSYNKMVNWRELFSKMNAAGTYDAYICCFVGDNDTVIKMLTKKRTRLPHALPINKYEAFIFNPCVRVKDPHPELDFERADADDVNEVTAFISECGKKHDLFHKLDTIDDIKGLKAEDFYCLRRDGRIVAAAALWNRQDVKQYYVKECKGVMKLVRALNPILQRLGYVRILDDDSILNFAYVSFLEAENDDPELMTSLFSRIKEAAKADYEALIISAAHSTPKHTALKKIRGISIQHNIAQIVMNGINDVPPADINGQSMDLDCALL